MFGPRLYEPKNLARIGSWDRTDCPVRGRVLPLYRRPRENRAEPRYCPRSARGNGPGQAGSPGTAALPAPPIEPAGPPKGVAPSPEPEVTVLPPLEASQRYGILAGSYKKYRDAEKMLARLKKAGKPAFIQRDPRNINRYQVWLGPFPSQSEAEDAAKSLRAVLKKPLKIEAIENPVPK